MKHLPFMMLLWCLSTLVVNAQYVSIPNAKVLGFFKTNYPACMVNDKLDTTCPAILNETTLNLSFGYDIDDIAVVQYFKSLTFLNCSVNKLSSLPKLPATLQTLYCHGNLLSELPALPDGLVYLDCNDNDLTSLPKLPSGLTTLYCYANQLLSLPTLPNALSMLQASYNQLTELPALPSTLQFLYCGENSISVLPDLPQSLKVLSCDKNALTNLQELPKQLKTLDCSFNLLDHLPKLPGTLQGLFCSDNKILCMPVLPAGITDYAIENNLFTCLPNYFNAMDAPTKALFPLCKANDPVNNPNACYDSLRFAPVFEFDILKNITVYPNPSSAVFNIVLPEELFETFSTVEVYDAKGLLVYSAKMEAGSVEIDLGNEADGLYFMILKGHDKSFHYLLTKN